jgi:hypothetical protein
MEDNAEMGLKEIELSSVNNTHLSQDMDYWPFLMNLTMNLWAP